MWATRVVIFSIFLLGVEGFFGEVCRPANPKEGGCSIDGKDCDGEKVELQPVILDLNTWNSSSAKSTKVGSVDSYAINGKIDTWEMYLHGPHIHASERESEDDIPAMYVFGTLSNAIYRFENFSRPISVNGKLQPLTATQKMVGKSLAPSTGYLVEDSETKAVKGMLIAEGNPSWLSNADTFPPHEVYKGGVEFLPVGHKKNCTKIFPKNPLHKIFGQVVNTIDCHKETGVCFFTVWKYYDDEAIIWNNFSKAVANDCLYYCILEKNVHSSDPECKKIGIVKYENGENICHKKNVGAVHGMTVGNTDPDDPTKFDILLVFTGKAKMSNGESSMKKVAVQVVPHGLLKRTHDLKTLKSEPWGVDLFTKYPPKGLDAGGDHAWVDETKKYVWVSCFRVGGLGIHMLDYKTGELIYSVTGLDRYVPNQYTYTAGIHGIGTIGKKGSVIAIATSSCHSLKVCIPTLPWHWPVPKSVWSTAPFIIVDLATIKIPESKPTQSLLV